jgi:hypothetical protein
MRQPKPTLTFFHDLLPHVFRIPRRYGYVISDHSLKRDVRLSRTHQCRRLDPGLRLKTGRHAPLQNQSLPARYYRLPQKRSTGHVSLFRSPGSAGLGALKVSAAEPGLSIRGFFPKLHVHRQHVTLELSIPYFFRYQPKPHSIFNTKADYRT